MSSKPTEQAHDIIPDVLLDPGTKKRYIRGKFLGKVREKIGFVLKNDSLLILILQFL